MRGVDVVTRFSVRDWRWDAKVRTAFRASTPLRAQRGPAGHLRCARGPAQRSGAGVHRRHLAALQGALPAQRGQCCAQAARVRGARCGEVDLPAADARDGGRRRGPRARRAGANFPSVAAKLRDAEADVLAYLTFPVDHWKSISSTNAIPAPWRAMTCQSRCTPRSRRASARNHLQRHRLPATGYPNPRKPADSMVCAGRQLEAGEQRR